MVAYILVQERVTNSTKYQMFVVFNKTSKSMIEKEVSVKCVGSSTSSVNPDQTV